MALSNYILSILTFNYSDINKAVKKPQGTADDYWPPTPPEVRKQMQEQQQQQEEQRKKNKEVLLVSKKAFKNLNLQATNSSY